MACCLRMFTHCTQPEYTRNAAGNTYTLFTYFSPHPAHYRVGVLFAARFPTIFTHRIRTEYIMIAETQRIEYIT